MNFVIWIRICREVLYTLEYLLRIKLLLPFIAIYVLAISSFIINKNLEILPIAILHIIHIELSKTRKYFLHLLVKRLNPLGLSSAITELKQDMEVVDALVAIGVLVVYKLILEEALVIFWEELWYLLWIHFWPEFCA